MAKTGNAARDDLLTSVAARVLDHNAYDSVPYVSNAYVDFQCRRLESVAALHALTPAAPHSASVLELGSGGGVNLIAQAIEYPASRFVGCDSSAAAITAAEELIQNLGLKNVELRRADISHVDNSWGKFDYIICHGVYSWVGADIRSRILKTLRENLHPSGIGCISYNTFPGWHLRRAVRDLVCHHAANFSDPSVKIAQAREFLAMAAESQSSDTSYAKLMKEEYCLLSGTPDSYLFHEMLEKHNQPFYFIEFVEQIVAAGLQYVGDAKFSHLDFGDLSQRFQMYVKDRPFDVREQYADFLRGTALRASVVCQSEARLDHGVSHRDLNRYHMALRSDTRIVTPEANSEESNCGGCELQLVNGHRMLPCADSATAAVIRHLNERRPEFVAMQELSACARAVARFQSPLTTGACAGEGDASDPADQCLRFLWSALAAGAIEASLSPPQVTRHISERPVVGTLARIQARHSQRVANQLRESIRLSDASRFVASLLDGTCAQSQLPLLLRQAINEGSVVPGPLEYADNDDELVRKILANLCSAGLLIA